LAISSSSISRQEGAVNMQFLHLYNKQEYLIGKKIPKTLRKHRIKKEWTTNYSRRFHNQHINAIKFGHVKRESKD
jgi:hypothetical protein